MVIKHTKILNPNKNKINGTKLQFTFQTQKFTKMTKIKVAKKVIKRKNKLLLFYFDKIYDKILLKYDFIKVKRRNQYAYKD